MPRIAFHSFTTRALSVKDDLQLAKQTGYDGIISTHDKINKYLKDNNQKDLRDLVKQTGVAVFGISNIHMNLLTIGKEKRTVVKRYARLVRTMKGNFISITPTEEEKESNSGKRENLYEIYAHNLTVLAEAAEEYGVNLSIEPETPHPLFSSPVSLTYIINKADRENLGFTFDPFSYLTADISLEEIETMENYFHAVYLADMPDKRNLTEKDRMIPGEGVLDFERILRIVHECSFKGVFALKLYSAYRTKKRNRQLLRKGRESIEAYLGILNYL